MLDTVTNHHMDVPDNQAYEHTPPALPSHAFDAAKAIVYGGFCSGPTCDATVFYLHEASCGSLPSCILIVAGCAAS